MDLERRQALAAAITLDARQFLTAAMPPVEFLVEQQLPTEGIALITGETGTCKSWIAYDLIRAMQTGGRWLNGAKARPGPCVLFNFDNPTALVRRRLQQLGMTEAWDFHVHTPHVVPQVIRLPKDAEGFLAVAQEYKAKLVIIDSLRQAHTGSEKDSQHMGEVMACLKDIASSCSCLVMVLHHSIKGSLEGRNWTSRSRGSGEIEASSDVLIATGKSQDKKGAQATRAEIEWEKTRAWPMEKPHWARLTVMQTDDRVKVEFTTHVPGRLDAAEAWIRVTEFLASRGDRTTTPAEIATETGVNKFLVHKSIMRGLKDGCIGKVPRKNADDNHRAVVWHGARE